MERDVYKDLLSWKISPRRKPLLLRGARQTGKTYILRKFGSREYENFFYFNFEENPEIGDFFTRSLQPEKIIAALSVYAQKPIRPDKDLLIFDEIQSCGTALTSLKYFQEEKSDYHIAVAGSLLGIKMSTPGTFPVGKVNLLHLGPMTFLEFLDAIGQTRFRTLIETIDINEGFALPFHEDLIDLLRTYYFVGGMPEAVETYAATRDPAQVRSVHKEILDTYELDFAKHAPTPDIPRLSTIWHSLPVHLSRENKRFLFKALSESARGRDYADALQWLQDAGLIHRADAISHIEVPLAGFVNEGVFKAYSLDIGILSTLAGIPASILAQGSEFFQTYHGAFVENYVAQQIAGLQDRRLFYWKSEGKKAEIDFVYEYEGRPFPLEVKAGINTKSKSLRSYDTYYNPPVLIRASLLNLKQHGKILNIPLYAIGSLERLLKSAIGRVALPECE